MARFKNDYNITEITMHKKIHALCTIGQDWFTSDTEIFMMPGDVIPDYIEIDEQLSKFEGKELIIEELANGIIEELKQYNPRYLKVTSKVSDAMHLPVEVTAEYYKN